MKIQEASKNAHLQSAPNITLCSPPLLNQSKKFFSKLYYVTHFTVVFPIPLGFSASPESGGIWSANCTKKSGQSSMAGPHKWPTGSL